MRLMLIDRHKAGLLVIDVQERLVPAMQNGPGVLKNCRILLQTCVAFGVPITVSEQYPQGLGPTVPELAELIDGEVPLAKVEFSCVRNEALAERLLNPGREQVILAGIETHVCVLQTALDLTARGKVVFVVADASSSRFAESKEIALRRMADAGVGIVTTEMVVFEMLRGAGEPAFRELSRLIR